MADRSARRQSLGEIFTRDFLILSTINLSVFFGFQMLNVGLPIYMDQLGAGTQIVARLPLGTPCSSASARSRQSRARTSSPRAG